MIVSKFDLRAPWSKLWLLLVVFFLSVGATYTSSAAPAGPTYAGRYKGTFSGDDKGTWQLTVSRKGAVSGKAVSAQNSRFDISGKVSKDGSIVTFTGQATGGIKLTGRISPDGQLSGTWVDRSPKQDGRFKGRRLSNSAAAKSSGLRQ